jgi:hypothetical protein
MKTVMLSLSWTRRSKPLLKRSESKKRKLMGSKHLEITKKTLKRCQLLTRRRPRLIKLT